MTAYRELKDGLLETERHAIGKTGAAYEKGLALC